MLDYIRGHAKSLVVKVILGIIVAAFGLTIFVTWGVGEKEKERDVIAKVNGKKISYTEFGIAYGNKLQFYRNIYKERLTPEIEKELDLKRKTLDELIDRQLMREEAEKEGLAVSDEEVKTQIKSMPAFQENGQFSPGRYKALLDANRLSPARFENEQREYMLFSKVTDLVKDQVKVSRAELMDEFTRRDEKIKVKYITFGIDQIKDKVEVNDEEIAKYYNEHKEDYKKPERRNAKYLVLDIFKIAPSKIDEKDIQAYYEANKDKYTRPEQVEASHILFKLTPTASPKEKEQIKKKAQGVLARAKAGDDFSKLATQFSQDEASAKMGGNLGYFSRGRMVPAFENAAFSMGIGQVSDLVESEYGYHIIKVTNKAEAGTSPLAEITPQIQRALQMEKAKETGMELADDVYNNLYDNKITWESVVARPEWDELETALIGKDEMGPGAIADPKFREMIFKTRLQEISSPLETPRGIVIAKVIEIKPAYVPELAEVKDQATADAKTGKALDEAKKNAEAAAQKVKEQQAAFETLAPATDIKESELFDRRGFVAELGSVQEFSDELFALKQGQVSNPVLIANGPEKKYALFLLAEKQAPKEEDFKKQENDLRTQLISVKGELALKNWLAALRKKAEIEINESLIK